MSTYDPAGTNLRARTHPKEPAGLQVRATPALRNPTLVALPDEFEEVPTALVPPPLPGTVEPPDPPPTHPPILVSHHEAGMVVALFGILAGITFVLVVAIILLVQTA